MFHVKRTAGGGMPMSPWKRHRRRTLRAPAGGANVLLPGPRGEAGSIFVDLDLWNMLHGTPELKVVEEGKSYTPILPKGFSWDGCTASPDGLFGANFRPACFVHDLIKKVRRHTFSFLFYRNIFVCCRWFGVSLPKSMSAGALYSLVLYAQRIRRALWGSTMMTAVVVVLILGALGWFALQVAQAVGSMVRT